MTYAVYMCKHWVPILAKAMDFIERVIEKRKWEGGLRSAESLPFCSGRHSTSVFGYLLLCVHHVGAGRAHASCWSVEVEGSAVELLRRRGAAAALWSCCSAVELLAFVYLSVSSRGSRGEGNNMYTHKVQTTAMPEEELQERDCWIPSPFSLLNHHWLDISPALVSECWELESGFPSPVSSFISLLIISWGFSNYVHVFFFKFEKWSFF